MGKKPAKNKVVLVNPGVNLNRTENLYGVYPNTAIMILGTILHCAGFEVKIVDGRYTRLDLAIRSICDEIDDKLVFIGFSVMTVQLPWAYHVTNAVKAKSPGVKIVWGGVHPTLFPEQTVADPNIDIVAVNDTATTIVPLTTALAHGSDLSRVPGICYKERSRVVNTPANADRDTFANVPLIDFSLLDHERYSTNNIVASEEFYGGRYRNCKTFPILTGLGCAYRCTFCINVILQRKYRFKEAGEIVDRIRFLRKNYGADFIQPMDENFFISKKRTFEFLDLLEKEDLKIKWRPQGRADYFNDDYLNLETSRRLDKSGMVVVAMGVESASQDILDRLKKNMKVEQIVKAVEILSKTNIVPKLSFMVGLPGETEKEIRKTYALAIRIRKMIKKSCVTVSTFRPYPGSELYNLLISQYHYKPPTNLRDWAAFSERENLEFSGYESFDKYTWLPNARQLRVVQYVYNNIAWFQPERDKRFWGKRIGAFSFLQFKFWFFPEWSLFFYRVLRFLCFFDLKRFRAVIARKAAGV